MRKAREGLHRPTGLDQERYEKYNLPNDWNQVSVSIEKDYKDRNNPFDAMGFSELEIWCAGAMVADLVEDSNCETLWLGGGTGEHAAVDGQSDPCYEKTNRRKIHALYNRPKGKLSLLLINFFHLS